MKILLWGLVAYAVVAILIALEGRRQRRVLEARGERSTGSRMMAAGMLELQGMLQADRKVEAQQIELMDEEHVRVQHERDEQGDGHP